MRTARCKGNGNSEVDYYHCFSRVVDGRPALGDVDKEQFVMMMRGYELFCAVRVITYCILDDHFSLLVEIPHRPEPGCLPAERELLRGVRSSQYLSGAPEQVLAGSGQAGEEAALVQTKEKIYSRMWDLSWFMRMLKQRFTQGFNSRVGRHGTLWEGRFRSLMVEGTGPALATMASYIDLDPVRCGKVTDPKDYRWSGYAEAVRGGRLARKGLQTAIKPLRRKPVARQRVVEAYRSFLLEPAGMPLGAVDMNGEPARAIHPKRLPKKQAKKRDLELSEALRGTVRAFQDGMVLGSRAFVEEFFQSHRQCFGTARKTGARKLQGIDAPELYVARALRVRPLG